MTDSTIALKKVEYTRLQADLEDLQTKLQNRDQKYLEIADLQDPQFRNRRIEYFIQEKVMPLVKEREDIGKILHQMYQNSVNLNTQLRERTGQYQQNIEDLNITLEKLGSKEKREENKVNFLEREHQILKYNTYVYDVTIHILYIMVIVLIIASLVVALNYFYIIDRVIVGCILLVIFLLFILYAVKVLVVDRVNINNYFYNKKDFNRPENDEIKKGDGLEDTLEYQIYKNDDRDSECNRTQSSHGTGSFFEERNDNILNEVKRDVGEEVDNERCLILR
jgi:hypothetical protein